MSVPHLVVEDVPVVAVAGGVAPSEAAPSSARRWPLALFALGAVGLAVGIATLDASPVGASLDDAMYVILAKSLATGQGYRYLNLPGAPAGTHFPPGYPALLALLWRLAPEFPANLMLFKAMNAVWLAIATVATARFARQRLMTASWSIAAGLITAVSAPLLILGAMLMSEPFFLALLLLLLPKLEEFVARPASDDAPPWWEAALLGAAIGIGMLIRTHAIVLVPAMALLLLLRRRWRDAAVVTGVALCVLAPWQLWSARHANAVPAPLLGEYGSYLGWWARGYHEMGPRMIAMTLERTVGGVAGMFAMQFSPLRNFAGNIATLVALVVVFALGISAQWRRIPVTLLFLAGYFAIILLWPYPSSRFAWSVWPLFILLLLGGARRIVELLRSGSGVGGRAFGYLAAAAVLWIAAGYAAYEGRAIRGRWWTSIPRAATARIVPAVQWTLANTAPGDVIASDHEGAIFLYTGRRTVPIRTFTVQQYLSPLSVTREVEDGLLPILGAYPVRTLVVGNTASLAAAEWLAATPTPRVMRREAFHEGAAFTVLPR